MKKSVAVIGLGIMGHGVADNFLKNGYDVTVWNRNTDKADDLVAAGAKLAGSVKEAVQATELIFEVTANDESSKEMWFGADGIIANAKPEQYVITCATLSVAWTDELSAKCTEAGLVFFDMPMTGGRLGAETGQLTLLVGGSQDKLNEFSNDLKAIAKDVRYFGEAGSGMRYKLILNTLQAIHMAGLGEALRMADAVGLDKNLVGDALAKRPGGVITEYGWDCYKHEPKQISFSVEWITKDLSYAADMVKAAKHPFLDDALRQCQKAMDQGLAQSDWSQINKLS